MHGHPGGKGGEMEARAGARGRREEVYRRMIRLPTLTLTMRAETRNV